MRKKRVTAVEPLNDFSSKTEICNRISNTIEPENKTVDSNKKSSNCKTFDLLDDEKKIVDFDEMSQQTAVQSVSSNKLSVSQKKRTCRSNIKATRKKNADSIADFPTKIEFSNAVELQNKPNSNKISSNCKSINLLDNLKKEFDFNEKFEPTIVQSPVLNKFTVSEKKRTCKSNIKTREKRKANSINSLTDFSFITEFCNGVSDAVEHENKTVDSNKVSNYKSFDLLDDKKEFDFDEQSKQNAVLSFSSNKLTVTQRKRTCRSNIKHTRKRKTDSLADFPSNIEFSNAVELENKTNDNKISSNCKTFDLLDDEKSEQTTLQSFSPNKLTVAQRKRTCRSNIKHTRKRKTDSVADFPSKIEFSNAVELKNKTNDNKISSNCKTFDLLADEKSEQTTLQSFSSNKLIVSQRKRTSRSNIKTARKRKAVSIDSLADFSSKIEFSSIVELENKDSNKTSNFKSFDLLKDIAKNFDKNSDQITIKPLSSNKLIDQPSKTNSNLNLISNLGSIIDKVKNLEIHPPIHIYSIASEGKGLSAVDVSQNLAHLAYSFPHSHEIHICSRKSLSDSIARNVLRNTWLNFASARNRLTTTGKSGREKTECLSSPQEYIFSHNDDVSGLRFSSNDNLLLSCSLDGSVKVISTITYRVLELYSGYGFFTDIDVSTDMTQFATTNVLSWNPYHVVCLYNFERKSPVTCLSGHENSLKCVRFHPNGLYVATAAADNCIKLWSVHQSKEVRNFKDEGNKNPEKITFSPDGKYIASTHSGCVKIWDLASGRKLKCLETSVPQPCNLNVCYSYTGNMLAAGGSDKKIHIWNTTSDESSEMTPDYNLLKSEYFGKRIFSIKYAANFFSCVTD